MQTPLSANLLAQSCSTYAFTDESLCCRPPNRRSPSCRHRHGSSWYVCMHELYILQLAAMSFVRLINLLLKVVWRALDNMIQSLILPCPLCNNIIYNTVCEVSGTYTTGCFVTSKIAVVLRSKIVSCTYCSWPKFARVRQQTWNYLFWEVFKRNISFIDLDSTKIAFCVGPKTTLT
jgi:hypothetical protein